MTALLRLLPNNLPAFLRREIIGALSRASAEAFGVCGPALDHLTYDERLRSYALFTQDHATEAIESGRDLSIIRGALFDQACRAGARLRTCLHVGTMADVMAVAVTAYRSIGIEILGTPQGDVIVSRCTFSQFYDAPVCALISALDDGWFSGLSGGGRLTFTARQTEGAGCCRARLRFSGEAT